jgi:hypothetical protein
LPAQNKNLPFETIDTFKNLYPDITWRPSPTSTGVEGIWIKGNRWLTLVGRPEPEKGRWTYSIASLRMTAGWRAHQIKIQQLQKEGLNQSQIWNEIRTARLPYVPSQLERWENLVMNEAWAEEGTADLSELTSALQTTSVGIRNLSTNLSRVTSTISNESMNWRVESVAWRSQLDDAEQMLDQIQAQWGVRADRLFDLGRTLTSPGRIALLTGAGAAGAAVGGFAMNALIDGVMLGGQALLETVTGIRNREELLATFIRAREQYENLKPARAQIEELLDANLTLLEQLQQEGLTRQELLIRYQTILDERRLELKRYQSQRDAAEARGDARCATQIYVQMIRPLEEDITPIRSLVCSLDGSDGPAARLMERDFNYRFCEPGRAPIDLTETCRDLSRNFTRLEDIDQLLHQSRIGLAAGGDVYTRTIERRGVQSQRKLGNSAQRRAGHEALGARAARGAARSAAFLASVEIERDYERELQRYVNDCARRCIISGGTASHPSWDCVGTIGEDKRAYHRYSPAAGSDARRQLEEFCTSRWERETPRGRERDARLREVELARGTVETAAERQAQASQIFKERDPTEFTEIIRELRETQDFLRSISDEVAERSASQSELLERATRARALCRDLVSTDWVNGEIWQRIEREWAH